MTKLEDLRYATPSNDLVGRQALLSCWMIGCLDYDVLLLQLVWLVAERICQWVKVLLDDPRSSATSMRSAHMPFSMQRCFESEPGRLTADCAFLVVRRC